MKSAHKKAVFGKVIVYAILILIAVVMIIPFLWMLSASIKSDREVFQMNPFVWIPANPRWDNYVKIWTKIPFGRFVGRCDSQLTISVHRCKIVLYYHCHNVFPP